MGTPITSIKAWDSRWQQAYNLILKGKAWVAGRDPALRRRANYLSAIGVKSFQAQSKRRAWLKTQTEAKRLEELRKISEMAKMEVSKLSPETRKRFEKISEKFFAPTKRLSQLEIRRIREFIPTSFLRPEERRRLKFTPVSQLRPSEIKRLQKTAIKFTQIKKPLEITRREGKKLVDTFREQGVIWLKRQELEKRGITKSEDRALTAEEKRLEELIESSEKILGIKDSGAGYIPGEVAVPVTIGTSLLEGINKRSLKLRDLEKKRDTKKNRELKVNLKSEIEHIKAFARKAELFGLGLATSTISNFIAIAQLPAIASGVYKEIKEDPKNIIKIGKRIPKAISEIGEQAVEFYRISPTEAIGFVAGEALFFIIVGKGIGKTLRVAGKLSKPAVRAVRVALKGKKGTRMKILGTQGMKDGKIITKIIFTKGKRQIGGAIGTSTVKKGKVFTQTVGKVGKVGRIRKKFIQKGVFVGREVSIGKGHRFKIISQLKMIKNVRKLTSIERGLLRRLKGKGRTIRLTKDMEGLMQVGLGRIAQAPGTKLLRTAIRFPTGQLKKIKAKGLRIKDFISISAVFTKKDWSLIIGKTLMKKKDIIEFIGLIKGITPKTFISFSPTKQKLFSTALKQVVGTATATTQRGKNILPKLSPKAKNLIATSAGVVIKKAKVIVPKPIPTVKLKALATKQKQIGITRKRIATKQTAIIKQSQFIKQRQKILAKQAQTPAVKQKQKQLVKQRVLTKQKQKLLTKQKQKVLTKQRSLTKQRQKLIAKQVRIPIIKPVVIPKAKVPIVPVRKRRIIRVKKKPRIKQGYDIFGKHKGKFIRLNRVPLSKARALDRGAFAIDKSTGATYKIKGVGAVKKLGKLTKGERGHFSRTRKKYRTYRIQKGKRITLKDKFIEKRGRPRIDTRGEKRGLSLAKFAKKRGFIRKRISRRKPVRRIPRPKMRKPQMRTRIKSPQKKVRITKSRRTFIRTPMKKKRIPSAAQLKNLAKGRKILAQMRKR